MTKPTVNVLYTPGTNSHKETMWAFERVGAQANLLFLDEVLDGKRQLDDADVLCIPGGFSYGDHIGAGAVAGVFLREKLQEQLQRARRKPLIAICNGYQIAVRSGLFGEGIALTVNAGGTFRNIVRQRHQVDADTACVWLDGLQGSTLHFPCAHGEGRFVYENKDGWTAALRYPDGTNPDGSADDIGGITSDDGLLFGLMDHPERLLDEPGNLDLFANGVKAVS
jgi:phosphoribosylformylglycinamidine synthase subunit PurQ / glutaminase